MPAMRKVSIASSATGTSLVPAVTAWVGEHPAASGPMAAYGVVLLMAGVAYWILHLIWH